MPLSAMAREDGHLVTIARTDRKLHTTSGGVLPQITAPPASKVRVDGPEDYPAEDLTTASGKITKREDLSRFTEPGIGEPRPGVSSDKSSDNNGRSDATHSAHSDSTGSPPSWPSLPSATTLLSPPQRYGSMALCAVNKESPGSAAQTKPHRPITQEEMDKFLSYEATIRHIFKSVNEKYHALKVRPDEYCQTWHQLATKHKGGNKTMIRLYKPKLQSWKPTVDGFDNKYDCDSPLKEARTPDDLQWETWQAEVADMLWRGGCVAKDGTGKRICRM